MTAWIVTIASEYPEHMGIAFEDKWWDFGQRRDIRAGDDLFFWQAGVKKVVGWATTTSSIEPRTEEMPPAHWTDDSPTRYRYRVHLVKRAAAPVTSPTWDEVRARIGTKASPNIPVIEVKTGAGERFLKSLFLDASSEIDEALLRQLTAKGAFLDAADRRLRRVTDVVIRPGQSGFRDGLLVAYDGRCAISGSDVTEVLEAAHIVSYRGMQSDSVKNGLLLRVDLHRLFDKFLVTVGADRRVRVAPGLREGAYGDFHGKRLRNPIVAGSEPADEALENHWKACDFMTSAGQVRI
ncbi:HNH endonuclease [Tsukamurella sp. M9C]|uniref:HNH endonuclease n=1 Tax=Tsukamurella sp. M9C TaxID=2877520 RepID=UPI001CCDD4BD|nr:HNH endonuclease [Tsukamurella sp. M9C]MCA0156409.1 HNH endonuclease [Tsukamurella sp. M9C]